MLLWLIGMMGSGKTRVGEEVAHRLGLPFHDSDTEVERRSGCTIAELFRTEGEDRFRDLEQQVIRVLAASEGVVATGGGAVVRSDNVATMRGSGRVVWLDADAGTLAERLGEDPSRPLLGDDPLRSLEELAASRRALYRAAADFRVATDGRSPQQVAEEVVRWWNGS